MIVGNDLNMVNLYQKESLPRVTLAKSQDEFILGQLPAGDMCRGKAEIPFLTQLATRELEILSLLSQGYTNTAIVGILFIDVKTVEHHLNNMHRKLRKFMNFAGYDRHLRVSEPKLSLKTIGESITLGGLGTRLVPCLFN